MKVSIMNVYPLTSSGETPHFIEVKESLYIASHELTTSKLLHQIHPTAYLQPSSNFTVSRDEIVCPYHCLVLRDIKSETEYCLAC